MTLSVRPIRLSPNQPNAVVRGNNVTFYRCRSVVSDSLKHSEAGLPSMLPIPASNDPPNSVCSSQSITRSHGGGSQLADSPVGPAPMTSTSQWA